MSGETHLELQALTKVYGSDVRAVDEVNLSVGEGEFVTIVGPSGCGKTSMLRMIAGFVRPTSGSVIVNDNNITDIPPNRRDLGMVFQSIALFPHMTVGDNISYGIRMSSEDYSKAEIASRIEEMLNLVELGGYEDRMPSQLSGGQQQRVGLARALAPAPELLLLDEPLAALDENLREQMQAELSRIQRELGVTTVFVTHNQEEAMTMSDKLVVMNQGQFEQVGTPKTVYDTPNSRFVAEFIGTSNVFQGPVTTQTPDDVTVSTNAGELVIQTSASYPPQTTVTVIVRPEAVSIRSATGTKQQHSSVSEPNTQGGRKTNTIKGEIDLIQMLGGFREYRIYTNNGDEIVAISNTYDEEYPSLNRGDSVSVNFFSSNCKIIESGDSENASKSVSEMGVEN